MLPHSLGKRDVEEPFHVFWTPIIRWEKLIAEGCSDHRSEDNQLTVDA